MELHLLCDGFFTLDKSLVVYMKYMGQPYEAALKPLLIQSSKENILIDTGVGELPEKYRKFNIVKRKPEQSLVGQLARHSLRPQDIDIVVNTHLHFDHCGNNALFPNAKFIVQADEFDYALQPERFQEAAYIKELFEINADYKLVRGEFKISDEIRIMPTPGHSIAHQSVVVEAADRRYVYCGDAAPIRENLERRNVPGVLYSAHQALESIDRLRALGDAVYVYSHDNEQIAL